MIKNHRPKSKSIKGEAAVDIENAKKKLEIDAAHIEVNHAHGWK